ncbi:kinetochor protein Mis14/NSL1 [Coccidioides immitis RS]|uniref:Kinetochor protein Mis14/NSL1 n=3 Tax=Coccidioides immitis TaxID=5501 RepID=J3KKB2_COCIM|nr:kinetochor protein Mis14/NSL1 [Coccidioides immitis RS]EAS36596.3 kinetochor protein Mis14/NSL1 [Coccidioides immitis RS]KMU79888.1 hypothetical protein CISG_07960 [Coccidioides immitis RMSCC 3703]KMU88147.1 hypothetical protein CIHG_05318 [Coccidioides immitis H538.4]TPX25309.1 hypothetical protein DIZ76_010760 [Coccidioides immitis]
MQAPHHRKIELQSTADLAYLYTNALNLSRQKLDLHFPPSANNDSDDPMKARVRGLVDEFIAKTFTSAIPSISINGLDTSAAGKKGIELADLLSMREQVEYEPYDSQLAARVTSLYAQLESLTTTVAQMRRDAPVKAAKKYAKMLRDALEEDDKQVAGDGADADYKLYGGEDLDSKDAASLDWAQIQQHRPEWILDVPFGSQRERERWCDGEIGEVYADGLKTLVRLQGEATLGKDDSDSEDGNGHSSKGLAATVGKVERARQAAEVVEKM